MRGGAEISREVMECHRNVDDSVGDSWDTRTATVTAVVITVYIAMEEAAEIAVDKYHLTDIDGIAVAVE
eukprot:CAMPEP_0175043208 /NCGR_PEP_ID=MMETSP0052_2-20121109/3036_1 /TAXON_ID=51329 ORGANISM="Polytomella parva, Strain SAG 63-3" /NCGR_SAMPLE_ID=MMETSP0052_2 /ASSEMBLY_ACC=CAM_ASM_000194 /LENGTH=68 /DNA_ID=CAMNT_0016306195 /DNA_START=374 /DNA_END=580 /DNA_ORIENTATION=+